MILRRRREAGIQRRARNDFEVFQQNLQLGFGERPQQYDRDRCFSNEERFLGNGNRFGSGFGSGERLKSSGNGSGPDQRQPSGNGNENLSQAQKLRDLATATSQSITSR
jgi:hypothetical protein